MDEESVSFTEVLSTEQVAAGLSKLGCVDGGSGFAYVSVDLSHLKVSDISAIADFPYMQHLNLHDNLLTHLYALQAAQSLVSIDASKNHLDTVLEGLQTGPSFHTANFSSNRIHRLPDLAPHAFMRRLILDDNQIEKIEGVDQLVRLEELSIARNRLKKLEALPPRIRKLNVSSNQIMDISALKSVADSLEELNLEHNQVIQLKDLSSLTYLRDAYLADNNIHEVLECTHLSGLELLRTLTLKANPMCSTVLSQELAAEAEDDKVADDPHEDIPTTEEDNLSQDSDEEELEKAMVKALQQDGMAYVYAVLSIVPQITRLDGNDVGPCDKAKARVHVDQHGRVRCAADVRASISSGPAPLRHLRR